MDQAREFAMREAFAEVMRLRQAMVVTERIPEAHEELDRLADQHNAIAQPWETGPDAAEWEWLHGIALDWHKAPEAMRRQMDVVRHDLRAGLTPYTPIQARSMAQAGILIDGLYRQQIGWRDEHLDEAAHLGSIDAGLQSPDITAQERQQLTHARTQLRDTRTASAGQWSPERQAWERQYRIDPANREEERQNYDSAYTAEANLQALGHDGGATATTSDPGRDAARIRQLLDAATPSEPQPTTTHPEHDDPDPAAAVTARSEHEPQAGAGYELE